MTSALTVLLFSVVLAETFAAVGLATVIPAAFVEMVRVTRRLLAPGAGATAAAINTAALMVLRAAPPLPGMPAPPGPHATPQEVQAWETKVAPFKDTVIELLKDSDKLMLMVPKSATIDAEFNISGGESYAGNVGGEGVLQYVGVKAGYSMLFEMKSSATVRMHVEFAPVEYSL